MKTPTDHKGTRFGKLVALHLDDGYVGKGTKWVCRCECGNLTSVLTINLLRGFTKSCGCGRISHGMASTPEYHVWISMKQRCLDASHDAYENYGGRGITIHPPWINSFEAFYVDMGPRPGPEYSIDRRDVNENYTPANCRWATWLEQANNKRNNYNVSFDGRTQTLSEWSRELSVGRTTLAQRLASGMSPEQAFTTPIQDSRFKTKDS